MNLAEIKQRYIGKTIRVVKGYAEGIVGKVLYVYQQDDNIYLSVDAENRLVFPRLDEVEIIRFKTLAKNLSKKLNLTFLETPIVIRWCETHQRYEWVDTFSHKGGVGYSLNELAKTFKKAYYCGMCGFYHVCWILHYPSMILEKFENFLEKYGEKNE
jgi:hypothetical protein